MLPAIARLRRRSDFVAALRRGPRTFRVSGPLLVMSLHSAPPVRSDDAADADPARVGIVVSRAVGTAVLRNRVKRRLRALAAARHRRLPAGSSLVVQAKAAAARASSAQLAADLDAGLSRLLTRVRI